MSIHFDYVKEGTL